MSANRPGVIAGAVFFLVAANLPSERVRAARKTVKCK